MKDNSKIWDKNYLKNNENVPWYIPKIPLDIRKVFGKFSPCKTLDVGCGFGQYANFLAKKGFDITAVDFSKEVITKAKKKYPNIKFVYANVLNLDNIIKEKFDLIYDISLFHHIAPAQRTNYARQISKKLISNGKFVLCAFDVEEKYFEGQKKKFSTETNTTMYPVDKLIIRNTFEKLFDIEEIKKITFGKEYKRERWLTIMRKK